MVNIGHGGHYYLICHRPNTGKLCDPLSVWPSSQVCVMHPTIITFRDRRLCKPSLRQKLLLPLLSYLLVSRGSLCPLCLLHGPPLPISGCWSLQSPPFLNNLISRLLCMPSAMQGRTYFTSPVNSAPTMHGMSAPIASVLFWLPPFPVVPPTLSPHHGTGFYGVAFRLHVVSL